jgi:filamentous hemagglutinin family protein
MNIHLSKIHGNQATNWRQRYLLFATMIWFWNGPSAALPTGEQVISGSVSTSRPTSNSLRVDQGSARAILNWTNFSIGANESVLVQQPSASSVLLNRVTGLNQSEIFGRLSANGNVFLVNPNGILFGKSATVDVGGLVASTLDIRNEDFLAGRYHFSANSFARVRNEGSLLVRDGGAVALLGGQVENNGTISARLGKVGLAAGNKVTLDFAGDGLTNLRVDESVLGAQIRNGGVIVSDGGEVQMTVAAANALGKSVINQDGIVRARSLVERGGKIVLDGGSQGQVLASGTLDASGREPGALGGEVRILGQHVALLDHGAIDASGDRGGGKVLVGGSFQGLDPTIRNSEAVFMSKGATIRVDALDRGDGGTAVVWSDGATRAYGEISARGGSHVGNGGLIETSGHFLDAFGLRADAASISGRPGMWLLDPVNVTICGECDTSDISTQERSNLFELLLTPTTLTAQIRAQEINDRLSGNTSVTVLARPAAPPGNITIESGVILESSPSNDVTFTLSASGDVTLQPRSVIRVVPGSTGRLNVNLDSDREISLGRTFTNDNKVLISGVSTISTNGGNLNVKGSSIAFDNATINTGGGAVSFSSQGGALRTATLGTIRRPSDGSDFGLASIVTSGGSISAKGLSASLNYASIDTGGGAVVLDASADFLLMNLGEISTPTPTTIVTRGGNFSILGGEVRLSNTSIDTVGGAGPGAGSVSIQGRTDNVKPLLGISIDTTRIRTSDGSIVVDGRRVGSSAGGGVRLGAGANLLTETGAIRINGFRIGEVSEARGVPGTEISGATLVTTAGGSITITGLAIPARLADQPGQGIDLNAGEIRAEGGIPGTISIVGETLDNGSGLRVATGFKIGGAGAAGRIAVGASNNGGGDAIVLAGSIETAGAVTLTPARVAVDGTVMSADEFSIRIGGPDQSQFALSLGDLATIAPSASTLVVGSGTHTGSITLTEGFTSNRPLTLQNGGSNSNGIQLNGALNLGANTLLLSSGGTVTQTAPISASRLLLHGTQSRSNFDLRNSANTVSEFSALFDKAKESDAFGNVGFETSGPLGIAPLAGVELNAAGALTLVETSKTGGTIVAGDLFARSHTGNLAVEQAIGTLGSDITLVTEGIFTNTNNLLSPGGGGIWRIFAGRRDASENRGGLVGSGEVPNRYGCGFGAACAAALPMSENLFVYRESPTVTVFPDGKVVEFGASIPPLTGSPTGLFADDAERFALLGGFSTTATSGSDPGDYRIVASFTSPIGYSVVNRIGLLTITKPRARVVDPPPTLPLDLNLGTCLSSGPLIKLKNEGAQPDQLETEWTKRGQLCRIEARCVL